MTNLLYQMMLKTGEIFRAGPWQLNSSNLKIVRTIAVETTLLKGRLSLDGTSLPKVLHCYLISPIDVQRSVASTCGPAMTMQR